MMPCFEGAYSNRPFIETPYRTTTDPFNGLLVPKNYINEQCAPRHDLLKLSDGCATQVQSLKGKEECCGETQLYMQSRSDAKGPCGGGLRLGP